MNVRRHVAFEEEGNRPTAKEKTAGLYHTNIQRNFVAAE